MCCNKYPIVENNPEATKGRKCSNQKVFCLQDSKIKSITKSGRILIGKIFFFFPTIDFRIYVGSWPPIITVIDQRALLKRKKNKSAHSRQGFVQFWYVTGFRYNSECEQNGPIYVLFIKLGILSISNVGLIVDEPSFVHNNTVQA